MVVSIQDPGDSRLALYRGLRDADLRRSVEAEAGVFIVEGLRTVSTLLESPWPVMSLLMLTSRAASASDLVTMAEDRGADVFIADAAVIDTIAGFPVHRGVLALAHRVPLQPPGLLLRGASAVVVVEGVNDHENLGSIFRNAGGLGADAVFLDPSCCDPLYRRSVRVSLGSVLRIPFTRIERWPSALTELKEHGFTLVALDPTAPATLDAAPDIGKLAVMIGSEGDGLSEDALALADRVVRIPMAPGFDSLNVATALAIGLSHLIR